MSVSLHLSPGEKLMVTTMTAVCVQGGLMGSKGEVLRCGNVLDFMGCHDERISQFSFMGHFCVGAKPLSTRVLCFNNNCSQLSPA